MAEYALVWSTLTLVGRKKEEVTGQETGQQADGRREPASLFSTLLQLYSQLKKTQPDPAERLERGVRGLKRKQSKHKPRSALEASRSVM